MSVDGVLNQHMPFPLWLPEKDLSHGIYLSVIVEEMEFVHMFQHVVSGSRSDFVCPAHEEALIEFVVYPRRLARQIEETHGSATQPRE